MKQLHFTDKKTVAQGGWKIGNRAKVFSYKAHHAYFFLQISHPSGNADYSFKEEKQMTIYLFQKVSENIGI